MRNYWTWALLMAALFLISGCVPKQPTIQQESTGAESIHETRVVEPKEEVVSTNAGPIAGQAVADIQQETSESGGTLSEWKETMLTATGAESEESKTTAQCESLMAKKIEECSKHQGWSVDNAMEITDFKTNKHYEFQDVKRQDCPGTSPTDKPPYTIHTDTAFLDAQSDNTRATSYQVVCSINCNWWDCTSDLSGVWEGDYTELSGSSFCKFKEVGSKKFIISMKDDKSFSGSTQYSGRTSVTGGQHCEGGANSGTGTLSGTVSGTKVSGMLKYSSISIPFTATLAGDTLSGAYAYSTDEYGSTHSATGKFTLNKKK
ncbi:hypothetical protein HY490_02630 [Candidatus Woesearchaeota archaeon]|nr:hypothetical protein [Candidatus Woesearchaeota archaeon]